MILTWGENELLSSLKFPYSLFYSYNSLNFDYAFYKSVFWHRRYYTIRPEPRLPRCWAQLMSNLQGLCDMMYERHSAVQSLLLLIDQSKKPSKKIPLRVYDYHSWLFKVQFFQHFQAITTYFQEQREHHVHLHSKKIPSHGESLLIHLHWTENREGQSEKWPQKSLKKTYLCPHRMKKVQHDSAVQSLTEKHWVKHWLRIFTLEPWDN